MTFTVSPHIATDGAPSWRVSDGTSTHYADTNAAAWRLADKLNMDPLNKAQQTSDWSWHEGLSSDDISGLAGMTLQLCKMTHLIFCAGMA